MSLIEQRNTLMTQIETHPYTQALLSRDPHAPLVFTRPSTPSDPDEWCYLIERWLTLMSDHGIDDLGQPTSVLLSLRDNGYWVYPGEQDSVGWLLAVVEKDRLSYVIV